MTTFFQTLPPLRQLIGEEKAEYEKRLEEQRRTGQAQGRYCHIITL